MIFLADKRKEGFLGTIETRGQEENFQERGIRLKNSWRRKA